MAEVTQQEFLDLQYEIHDGMDRLDASLADNLALLRIINYEAETGMQRIAEARTRYYEKVSSR